MSSSKTLLAGMVGLAAGLAIGVLFAPAKGTKTRKRLKKKMMSLADLYENELFSNLDPLDNPEEEAEAPQEEEKEQENKL